MLVAKWFLPLALLVLPVHSASAQGVLTAAQWRADLRVLADSLVARHRQPFHKITQAAFDSAVADLDKRIPSLQDHEVIVGLARLAAMLGDGHTRLEIPQDFAIGYTRSGSPPPLPSDSALVFHHLPVRFDLFEEGLFIRAATQEHGDLIGAQVIEIGTLAADSALERIRPVAFHDNEPGFRFIAPRFLSVPEVLSASGVTQTSARTRLVVQDRSGVRRIVELAPVPRFAAPPLVEGREIAPPPIPLWEQRLDTLYWMAYLPSERAVYVQLNEINHQEAGESLVAFAARMERMVADSAADRLVIDLRHNPGGNNMLTRPFIQALLRSRVNRFGHLYVLIGGETFSAAQSFSNELEFHTNALFVGEPSGSTPSHFGDAGRFLLPASGLLVRFSTTYWRDWSSNEKRPWTPPHLGVRRSAADYFANRDPVLAAALAFRPEDLGALVAEVAHRGGTGQAINLLFRITKDVDYVDVELEPLMLAVGGRLLDRGWMPEAVEWFQLVRGEFPRSVPGHLGTARALERSGRRAEALEAANAALRIEPGNPEALRLRDELITSAP